MAKKRFPARIPRYVAGTLVASGERFLRELSPDEFESIVRLDSHLPSE